MRRLIVLLLLGCGSNGGDRPGSPDAPVAGADATPTSDATPVTGGCTITLSGALNGSFPCSAMFSRRDGESATLIGIGGSYSGAVRVISIVARLPDTPSVREYTADDFETIAVVASGNDDQFSASADVGLIGKLTITAVEARPPAYLVDGSFNAVLTGAAGHGAVTLGATF